MSYTAWENTVDGGAWLVAVEYDAKDSHSGFLVIKTREGVEVHRERTGISYGAIFGPDVDDVRRWSERTIEIIDTPDKRSLV